jgi:hypothetical protein
VAGWEEALIPCSRCGGLLVSHDLKEIIGARCISCGDLTDELILAHRAHRPEPYADPNLPTYDAEKYPY